jgi:hypothetical protein
MTVIAGESALARAARGVSSAIMGKAYNPYQQPTVMTMTQPPGPVVMGLAPSDSPVVMGLAPSGGPVVMGLSPSQGGRGLVIYDMPGGDKRTMDAAGGAIYGGSVRDIIDQAVDQTMDPGGGVVGQDHYYPEDTQWVPVDRPRSGLPWLWIGLGVAAVGGVGYFLLRGR